jgi:hypothetical protein
LRNIKPPAITGLAGLADAAKGISKSAFTAIADSFKPLQAGVPQNLTAINLKNKLEQVATDTKSTIAPGVTSFTNVLNSAGVDIATGKIPAVEAAVASGGVDAGFNALAGAMSNVPGMSGIVSPSAIASGVSNLPGGQSALSSIINSSSLTISGISSTLSSLGTITKNAASAAQNQISTASAGSSSLTSLLSGNALIGAGASLSGELSNSFSLLSSVAGRLSTIPGVPSVPGLPSISSLTKGLQSGKQALSSLVSTGLSPAAAAALTASINSLSTASPFPIKMPTVAEKTVDRSEISSQIKNLLGDKKIPSPNFSGLFANINISNAALAEQDVVLKQIAVLREQRYDLDKEVRNTKYTLSKARQELPQGDPQIPILENADATARQALIDLDAKIASLQQQQRAFATSSQPA